MKRVKSTSKLCKWFSQNNSCLGQMDHFGPKNDMYFWICSKENPHHYNQNLFIDEKFRGDTLSKTKFSAKKKKKIEENYQEITPQIKETVEKNPQKFKVFCLWQTFICLSILKHTP